MYRIIASLKKIRQPSTKLRVVFDFVFYFTSNVQSLNDNLMVRSTVLDDILTQLS